MRRPDAPLLVPATAALIESSGTRVALVRDGTIHWQTAEIGSDLGDRLSIATGLFVLTPSERLAEGVYLQAQGSAR